MVPVENHVASKEKKEKKVAAKAEKSSKKSKKTEDKKRKRDDDEEEVCLCPSIRIRAFFETYHISFRARSLSRSISLSAYLCLALPTPSIAPSNNVSCCPTKRVCFQWIVCSLFLLSCAECIRYQGREEGRQKRKKVKKIKKSKNSYRERIDSDRQWWRRWHNRWRRSASSWEKSGIGDFFICICICIFIFILIFIALPPALPLSLAPSYFSCLSHAHPLPTLSFFLHKCMYSIKYVIMMLYCKHTCHSYVITSIVFPTEKNHEHAIS